MGELVNAKLKKRIKKLSTDEDLTQVCQKFFKDGLAKTFFSKSELEIIFKGTGKYIAPSYDENEAMNNG